MSAQTVTFEYDPAKNLLFTEDDYTLATVQDVDAFLKLYQDQLARIGKKVWLVTGIDGLEVHAQQYEHYGTRIKALSGQWYLGFARWGTQPLARMTVRAASIRAQYGINIYSTSEAAIAAVEKMIRATSRVLHDQLRNINKSQTAMSGFLKSWWAIQDSNL